MAGAYYEKIARINLIEETDAGVSKTSENTESISTQMVRV